MQSQDEADILQIKRRTGGDLIAVGLPHDSAIFIQEYWADDTPFYAIANVSIDVATVSLAEWSGVVGRHLIGAWAIPPKTVRHYDVRSLLTDYSGSLLAVSLNENPIHGLLKSPKAPDQAADVDKPGVILTTYGLNGIGDRYAHLSCTQERLVYDAGRVVALALKIPENIGIISFKPDADVDSLPKAVVVGATSNTLSVRTHGDSYSIGDSELKRGAFHDIMLDVELPRVETELMVALWGHVACPSGAGFYFARGLIVAPEAAGLRATN